MMEQEAFSELIRQIEELGYDRKTAGRYAVLIGDTPVMDGETVVVVDGEGRELARLDGLPFFKRTE